MGALGVLIDKFIVPLLLVANGSVFFFALLFCFLGGYLITGYELFGDMSRKKYVPYITCHFLRTETGFVENAQGGLDPNNPSGCYLQAQWEWANSAAGGRWGTAQQVYRLPRLYIPTSASDLFDDGFSVCTTKSKLRGRGQSVSLYFYSEEGKDCHILGWSMAATGQQHV